MKRPFLVILACAMAASGFAGQNNTESLFKAIRAADSAAVLASIAAGADPNGKDKDGLPAILYAAVVANAATMRVLLDKGADPNAANPAGATALIYAAADAAKARLLVAHGAAVNAQSGPGATPLLVASSADGNADVVRLLLSKGAHFDVPDRIQGIPAVLSGGGGTTPLIAAARLRNPDTLRALLAAGANVHAKDANGATALSDAVLYENAGNVRLLLAAGAKVNFSIGSWKQTPLMAAAMRRNPEVVRMLLDAGADVNAADASDSTPLMWASYSEYGDAAPVRALLAAGANVNHANKWGETALTWASRRGETPVVAVLRDAGAQAEKPVAETGTAIIPAVRENQLATIRAAVESGIPPLQSLGAPSFKKTGCVSCHNAFLPMVVAGKSRDNGFRYGAAQLAENASIVKAFVGPATEPLRQGLDVFPDIPLTGGYLLEAFHAAGIAPNATTDALVHRIAQSQFEDGHWAVWAPRPPIEYSNVSTTALAVRALVLYGPPGRKQEFDLRIERARKWLETASVQTSEERNMRLLGLVWAQAESEMIHGAVDVIVAHQRDDGGWAQLDSLAPDAYATGQSLFALHESGLDAGNNTYRRGVAWLRQTQQPDGTWHVKTRAFPFQTLIDTGYPHGRDQWISSQASSWAVLALMSAREEPAIVAAER